MPFPRKLLNDNEDIILDLRPHWWFLVERPIVASCSSVAVADLRRSALDEGGRRTLHWSPRSCSCSIAVVWFARPLRRWTTTNFVVTTDRLIYRSGVLAKHGREIPLERVNDITFNQRSSSG